MASSSCWERGGLKRKSRGKGHTECKSQKRIGDCKADADGNDNDVEDDVETSGPCDGLLKLVLESRRTSLLFESKFILPARLLAEFLNSIISYIVVETRGCTHVGTPEGKSLIKYVFQYCQHGEEVGRLRNYVNGVVFEIWCDFMRDRDVIMPLGASKGKSSPAGNIIESYKMLAEQVKKYDGTWNENETSCINAYTIHLRSMVPESTIVSEEAVYVDDMTPSHGFTSVCFWVVNMVEAKRVACCLLDAFAAVHSSVLEEHFTSDGMSDVASDGTASQCAFSAAGRSE